MASSSWYVYLLRCADDSLYCGITNDVRARLAAHAAGKGARYTRGRGPFALVMTRRCRDTGDALRLEYAVKQLDREAKLALDAASACAENRARRHRASHRENCHAGIDASAVAVSRPVCEHGSRCGCGAEDTL